MDSIRNPYFYSMFPSVIFYMGYSDGTHDLLRVMTVEVLNQTYDDGIC